MGMAAMEMPADYKVLVHTTVYNALKDAGSPQLAELIRRL